MKLTAKEISEQYGESESIALEAGVEGFFVLTKLKMTDNEVKLTVESEDFETKYTISIDMYLDLRYRKGQILSSKQNDQLDLLHRYWYGYKKVLRKLEVNDKSEKEIREYLKKQQSLPVEYQNQMVDQLKKIGYLSDKMVAESQLYSDQYKLLGKKKTARSLAKRGVKKDVIEEITKSIDSQDELERGIKKAQLYMKGIRGKSYKETLYTLKQKLINDGFENADEILAQIDYNFDEEKELKALEDLYNRIHKRYSQKYSGKELTQKEYGYLYSKGYSGDMIHRLLERLEVDENEDW